MTEHSTNVSPVDETEQVDNGYNGHNADIDLPTKASLGDWVKSRLTIKTNVRMLKARQVGHNLLPSVGWTGWVVLWNGIFARGFSACVFLMVRRRLRALDTTLLHRRGHIEKAILILRKMG